jgi:hypothetical protein
MARPRLRCAAAAFLTLIVGGAGPQVEQVRVGRRLGLAARKARGPGGAAAAADAPPVGGASATAGAAGKAAEPRGAPPGGSGAAVTAILMAAALKEVSPPLLPVSPWPCCRAAALATARGHGGRCACAHRLRMPSAPRGCLQAVAARGQGEAGAAVSAPLLGIGHSVVLNVNLPSTAPRRVPKRPQADSSRH